MRGVYCKRLRTAIREEGSSPHARGLPSPFSGSSWWSWIIPACAGFTRSGLSRYRAAADHPRMRGVYILSVLLLLLPVGSSPHARGLPRRGLSLRG